MCVYACVYMQRDECKICVHVSVHMQRICAGVYTCVLCKIYVYAKYYVCKVCTCMDAKGVCMCVHAKRGAYVCIQYDVCVYV